ncbi:MAG: transglutaminase domain-containing protein [Deltaproteobacteria bacterium]|nr:transglutaminase domain-containing protein [Deltaproteobacteria bacterium]
MTALGNKRYLFNIFGAVIVAFWLTMIGMLVRKVDFKKQKTGIGFENSVITIDSAQREWKDIYLKDKKVGYAVNLIKPFKEGYFIQEEILLKLNLMDMSRSIHTVTQSRVDDKFLLKSFYFKMTSGVVSFNISGKVEGDRLLIVTGKGRKQKTRSIKLARPPMMGTGMGHFFKNRKISIGDTFNIPVFDPSTMSQKETVVRVVSRERIKINRMTYDAFRLETEMWGKLMTFWLDKDGGTLKEEGFMGMSTVKSSAANAPLGLEDREADDFYELTAVTMDKELPDPDRLSYLKLRLDGIDYVKEFQNAWNNGRQRFHNGVLEINKEKPPFKTSYSIPFDRSGDALMAFLEPEFNIENDAKEIIEMARRITGDENDPLVVTRKLLRWVYGNIEKRPVVSVPSALEVLRTRVGDCNEHATLLTALLRASGIPARLSTGLVYNRRKFFYHAWTEAYVGEWISMDATLNQLPADVSHITLMRGNLDKQLEITGLIGKLKLKLMDYRYD